MELFKEWVRQLDRQFSAANRKIALFIDNCTANPHVEQLNSIELIFLSPNTTPHTQTMDQGIIRSSKTKYRSLAVRNLIVALEKKNPVPTISIFSAMTMLEKAISLIASRKLVSLRKKWKKYLTTKMTPLLSKMRSITVQTFVPILLY